MDLKEAIINRHSVRQFKDQPIEEAAKDHILALIDECNEQSGLHLQLICDDPKCFDHFLAHYGKFTNVNNYIAVVANTSIKDCEETAGYYGQKLVLEAQILGLNTCWVGGTFSKGKCKAKVDAGEKLLLVIAIGYGENQGGVHTSKPADKLCTVPEKDRTDWFKEGLEAALLAPTALNHQKFVISLDGDTAKIVSKMASFSRVDAGIVAYNFEAACGHRLEIAH